MYIGQTQVNKIYKGNTEVNKIYNGEILIYSSSVTPVGNVQRYLDFNFIAGVILNSKPILYSNPTLLKIIQEKNV